MRKTFTLISALFLSALAAFSQPQIPDGYVSAYSVKPEKEQAPVAIGAVASYQLLGSANGWGTSTEYDFSAYDKLSFKITFDPADAGHQMAFRFSVNASTKLFIYTLPAEGTTAVAEINLLDYANASGQIRLGGVVLYNGATHWSFSYTGTPASKACTVDYVALRINAELLIHNIPDGYVSIYSIKPDSELTPLDLGAGTSYQLLGQASNWGSSLEYDLSNYEKLAIQVAFDPSDAGKEAAFRFSVNGFTYLHLFTLPTNAKVDREEINLADYADVNGKVLMGGIVFYNGATHWSFTYTNPATMAATIDYVAVKAKIATSINPVSVNENDPNRLVNVFNISGIMIRRNVRYSEAIVGLKQGLYIVGGQKVYITQ